MSVSNILIGSALVLSSLYILKTMRQKEKLCDNTIEERQQCEFEKLKNHVLNESSLSRNKKPILWIHLDFEQNARKYLNFASKNSKNLNMPYILLCIKTIIDNCGESFHVVVIDNSCFANLIPGWNINVSNLSDPLRTKYIDLAKLNILKNFGGLFVPPSFICHKNLYQIYYKCCVYNNKIMTFEFPNHYSGIQSCYVPKLDFIGASKNNMYLTHILQEYEYCLSKDYTSDSEFNGTLSRIFMSQGDNIIINDGKYIVTKDSNDKVVLIDDLMQMKNINMSQDSLGVYIPSKELKSRNKFNWILYLSPMEVLESKTFIGKHLSQSI